MLHFLQLLLSDKSETYITFKTPCGVGWGCWKLSDERGIASSLSFSGMLQNQSITVFEEKIIFFHVGISCCYMICVCMLDHRPWCLEELFWLVSSVKE